MIQQTTNIVLTGFTKARGVVPDVSLDNADGYESSLNHEEAKKLPRSTLEEPIATALAEKMEQKYQGCANELEDTLYFAFCFSFAKLCPSEVINYICLLSVS
jgi:hypothetical protein